MSTGERRRKVALRGLRLRFDALVAAEEDDRCPPSTPAEEKALRTLNELIERTQELIVRGQSAITKEDLKVALGEMLIERPKAEGPVFHTAFKEFLAAKDVKPGTLQDYSNTGVLFDRFFGKKKVHEVTGKHVQGFIKDLRRKGRSQRTQQKHLRCLREFFTWCMKPAEYVSENPTDGIKLRVKESERKKRRRGLTVEEARRLLKACRLKRGHRKQDIQHVWLAIYIALCTGLRLSNILELKWSQVDLQAGTISIRIGEDKFKTDRREDLVIPIKDELWRFLRLWRRLRAKKSPLVKSPKYVLGRTVNDLRTPFGAAVERAGIETDFHNLRHAFNTWLVEADVVERVRRALMGHASGSVNEKYAHPSLEILRENVNRLPRLLDR